MGGLKGISRRVRQFSRRVRQLGRVELGIAVLGLVAVPAIALAAEGPGAEHAPEEVPPSYTGSENPGGEYMPEEVPPPQGSAPEEVPPGYDGTENPGAENVPQELPTPEAIPPGYSGAANPGMAHVPVEPPPHNGSDNPGSGHRSEAAGTRGLAREHCQDYKKNFRDNKSQFGRCIADVAKSMNRGVSPRRACRNLSRRPAEGEHRSDFSACVAAAARALREQHHSE